LKPTQGGSVIAVIIAVSVSLLTAAFFVGYVVARLFGADEKKANKELFVVVLADLALGVLGAYILVPVFNTPEINLGVSAGDPIIIAPCFIAILILSTIGSDTEAKVTLRRCLRESEAEIRGAERLVESLECQLNELTQGNTS
jgi:hypothetical protein